MGAQRSVSKKGMGCSRKRPAMAEYSPTGSCRAGRNVFIKDGTSPLRRTNKKGSGGYRKKTCFRCKKKKCIAQKRSRASKLKGEK